MLSVKFGVILSTNKQTTKAKTLPPSTEVTKTGYLALVASIPPKANDAYSPFHPHSFLPHTPLPSPSLLSTTPSLPSPPLEVGTP